MGIALRPYQEKFIAQIRKEFAANIRRVVGVAPCGAGKTIMTGWMIREALKRDKRSIFFVHRKELIEQTSETFQRLNIPHGIISNGFKPHYEYPVQIASVQTLVNCLDIVQTPDFLVCDECHHILANTYKKIIDHWENAFLLGVTATPERTGGVRLNDVFDSMVQAPSVKELIRLGNLTKFDYYAPCDVPDLNNVDIVAGDYDNAELEKIMSDKKILSNMAEQYLKLADGKSAICYCVNVAHSKYVAESFIANGINAAHCDGTTPKDKRERMIDAFRHGDIKVLCNAELFGEGFDVPNMQAVILARPTKSLTLHIQQSMRPMRPDPNDANKRAIIIDCVGNCFSHGLPDDDRDWTLDPNKPFKAVSKYRTCPQCGSVVRYNKFECPTCGYKFPHDRQTYTFVHDGQDLVNVSAAQKNQSQPADTDIRVTRAPMSIEEFLTIAEDRGYKKSWAMFKALEKAKTFDDLLHIADVMQYQKKYGWAYHKAQELGIPTK